MRLGSLFAGEIDAIVVATQLFCVRFGTQNTRSLVIPIRRAKSWKIEQCEILKMARLRVFRLPFAGAIDAIVVGTQLFCVRFGTQNTRSLVILIRRAKSWKIEQCEILKVTRLLVFRIPFR